MTIFNSTSNNDYEARTLEVKEISGCVNFFIQRPEQKLGLNIENADIPAVALEAIKASGVKPFSHAHFTHGTTKHLQHIAYNLDSYIKNRDATAERIKREAERLATLAEKEAKKRKADRDELEALARTIYETHVGPGAILFFPWAELRKDKRAQWINNARAAREALNKA